MIGSLILAVLLLAGLAGFLYWLLVLTEGVYLGRRVVVWLYDITAGRYDGIKEFSPADEQYLISRRLLPTLNGRPAPWVLDVATGTGRVPVALLAEAAFSGRIVGLDPARQMLDQARPKLGPFTGRAWLVQQVAGSLPFADSSFDAVTCLEALEFFPSTEAALAEMVRVLRPGGLLLTSRRKGWEGRSFIGRYQSAADFEQLLRDLGLVQVESQLWELNYDMVIGIKGDEGR
jgi:ubiquinone/menaquinone biosynthesis C-methylase UbiE